MPRSGTLRLCLQGGASIKVHRESRRRAWATPACASARISEDILTARLPPTTMAGQPDVATLRGYLACVVDLAAFEVVRVCDAGASAVVFHCRIRPHEQQRQQRQPRRRPRRSSSSPLGHHSRALSPSGTPLPPPDTVDVASRSRSSSKAEGDASATEDGGGESDELANHGVVVVDVAVKVFCYGTESAKAELGVLSAVPPHPNVVPVLCVLGPCALPRRFFQRLPRQATVRFDLSF